MYKTDITHLHLEPTSDCNARCPQCPRTFKTTLKTNPYLSIEEWSPNELESVLTDPYFSKLDRVVINGNYGDIVKHSSPRQLIEVILKIFPKINIRINTNGGALNSKFWSWLGKQKNIFVDFGIDGLEDTHSLYRRNTRFDTVINNAQTFINSGGKATWVMTVFKHNEHQIEECSKLAKEMKFYRFRSRSSTRWHKKNLIVVDKDLKESYKLEPSSDVENSVESNQEDVYQEDSYKIENKNTNIDWNNLKKSDSLKLQEKQIQCVAKNSSSVYLSADKKLWPCCWIPVHLNSDLQENKYENFFETFYIKKNLPKDFNNVLKYSIKDIIKNGLYKEIEKSWSETPFKACALTCSKNGSWNIQSKKSKLKKF